MHDEDLADAIESCLNLDGENSPGADIDWGGFKITNLGFPTSRNHGATTSAVQDAFGVYGSVSGGSATAQTINLNPAITAYSIGSVRRFKAGFTTTGAATLNINGVGAQAMVYPDGSPLVAGSLVVDRIYVVVWNGTVFIVLNAERMILRAAVATTSGATISFTGIPANAKRITITLNAVSTNGTGELTMRLGDAGGLEATDYESHFTRLTESPGITIDTSTTAFVLDTGVTAATATRGKLVLELIDAATNTWSIDGKLTRGGTSTNIIMGIKALSAVLTQASIITADTFDAGAASLMIEC